MIKRWPVILLTIITAVSCSRPTLQPLDVAKKIFSPETDQQFIIQHSTGDYTGHPNGHELPAGITPSFRVLQHTRAKSVIAMNVSNTGPHADKYLFLTKDSALWKLYAIGAPTLARANERRRLEMEALTPQQVDAILYEAKDQISPEYKTRDQFDFIRNSLRLKLSPDDTLVAHFYKHKVTFDSLLQATQQTKHAMDDEQNTLVNTQTAAYRPLLISNITTGGFLPKQCIDFHILYDQIGYLYTPDEKYLPELHPDKVMMLRKLAKGWYLYKVAIYL
jgi:hypothetical protein